MKIPGLSRFRAIAIVAAISLAFTGVVAVQPAFADSSPADPSNPATPTTVSADVLPTPQIDGVVWDQVVVGNIDYAVGSFANARPYGSAAGVNTVTRNNILAYNVTTGALITTFAPSLNAQANTIAASPDGSRIYVGGDFTAVDGVPYYRVAAFSTATGAIIPSFKPIMGSSVKSLAATNSTVYLGGWFKSINGATRQYLGAVSAATGATLPFVANTDYNVNALTLTTDGTRLIVGGQFQNLSGNPALGLGAVDPTTGAYIPWAANQLVNDYGLNSSITSLYATPTAVYGSGYVWTPSSSNLEGVFQADPTTGAIIGMEDCHGDTYSVYSMNNVMYEVGHQHYCGNIGGFPQTEPNWTFHYLNAFSTTSTSTVQPNAEGGYYNFGGEPALSLQDFFPTFTIGSYTGQSQATWSVSGNGSYVVAGGEFLTVNGIHQQGLTRFAVPSIAPNKVGPSASALTPGALSVASGQARVSWTATYDQDNANLNYAVYRDSGTTPIYQVTQASNFYTTPGMGFIDTGLTPGSKHTYKVVVTDPFGNSVSKTTPSVTVVSGTPAYNASVTNAGASSYWPLNEASGSVAYDNIGFSDATLGTTTRGDSGPVAGQTATTFDGTSTGFGATQSKVAGPNTVTEQAWIKTTTTSGGKILGFGDQNTGDSSNYDRQIYMDNSGHLIWGVYDNGTDVLQSANTYNDGQWHQVTATLGANGMRLYVDGKQVGSRTDITQGQPYNGYWRIGGDNLGSWPSQPTSEDFAGDIAQVAIYPTVLGIDTIAGQYVASGRANPLPQAPKDAYGAAVFNSDPDLYWRLGDSSGSTAADSGPNEDDGIYSGAVSLGQPGVINENGFSETSAGFTATNNNGWTGGQVSSSQQFTNPSTYSLELWFKSTSTSGGKLIGFGDQQTGLSGSYDRHVYMQDNGQLVFGTWTGQENTITSPNAYNDGNWHYVVATQSSDGMNFYVDGTLVGTNPQTQAQAYTGYWKVGGDNTWGSDSPYFTGDISEVAVYSSELSASTVSTHYALGSNMVVNQPPTAKFTSSTSSLAASFDGSTSTDADGSVASYAWDFGDGTSGSGATPSHTYAASGAYNVTLTVTDNQGATGSITHAVSVVANQPPVATFSTSTAGLVVTANGSASSDPDGTVSSYAWTFGDGSTGTGAIASHTYAGAGTYTVTLTVTDNQGATSTTTNTVTVAPVNQPPVAAFTDSVSNLAVSFDGTTSKDPDGTIASYAWSFGDGGTATGATATHTYAASGNYTAVLTVTDNSGATNAVTHTVNVLANQPPVASFTSTLSYLAASFNASASNDPDGSIASYAWDFGDGTTGTGSTATHTYTANGSYVVTLTVTDDKGATGTTTHTVTVAANQPPVAAFGSSVSGLAASFNGTASSDPDGTVASYAWDFGDGTTGTGATTTHSYSTAGTYTVTLTVTDNLGLTNSSAQPVTVTATVAGAIAQDSFNRSVTAGWGSADLGGAWTNTGTATNFNVASGIAQQSVPKGSSYTSNLASVKSTSSDVLSTIALPQVPVGAGTYVSVIGRMVGTSDYEGRLYIQPSGAVQLQLLNSGTTVSAYAVPGLVYTAGKQLNLRVQVFGTAPTTLRARVWVAGTTEPTTWQLTTTDSSTTALQAAGSVGLRTYVSASSTITPMPVQFSSFVAVPVNTGAPNIPPVAAFTATPTNLTASFDGSASTDSDGSIANYAWNFGDGSTATGVTASHTYATAGTYTATLTVTDNLGATNTVTHSVTVTAPPANQPPVAAFTVTPTGLTIAANGSTSTDPDGTVSSYAWTFGDNTTGTGQTASHTYSAAGTYSVTLTVTDNQGLTNAVTHSVTVTAAVANAIAQDAFGRTVTAGWGSADVGGAWTNTGTAANFSVTGGVATQSVPKGSSYTSTLGSVSSTNSDVFVTATSDQTPVGAGFFISAIGRMVGTADYEGRLWIQTSGAVQLQLLNNGTVTSAYNVPGLVYTAGTKLNLRVQVFGTSPTTFRARTWVAGTTEPTTWQLTATDSTTAALQAPGSVALRSYVSASSTVTPMAVRFSNFLVVPAQ